MSTRYAPSAVLERARNLAAAGEYSFRLVAARAALEAAVKAGDTPAAAQRAHQLVNVTGDVMGPDAARWVAAGDDSYEGDEAA